MSFNKEMISLKELRKN